MGEVGPSVVVEGVGKRFDLHQARAGSLREALARKKAGEVRPESSFWALENVSFTVEPGHPLAIIGHNGSGKSTLLKLLTGILKPTKGNIEIRGRVGALIEVGAGFHPDLTGRENVYLNGSILGASKREMDARFDRIVAFAGLERFIDTPVKRYSSGMYMRLGFSIAAHLEPDILLIDEVLAVGDAQFQTRCLTYLKSYVSKGGSVIFVSHAMSQVKDLCDRVVWLDRGQMMGFGEAGPLIDRYESLVAEREDAEFQKLYPEEWAERERLRRATDSDLDVASEPENPVYAVREPSESNGDLAYRAELSRLAEYERSWRATQPAMRGRRLTGVVLRGDRGSDSVFAPGEGLTLTIRYDFPQPLPEPAFGVDFFRADGMHAFTTSNYDAGVLLGEKKGEGGVTFRIPSLCLAPGCYRVQINVYGDQSLPDWHLWKAHELPDAARFEVRSERPAGGVAWMAVEGWK